jgi:hypothetical protein
MTLLLINIISFSLQKMQSWRRRVFRNGATYFLGVPDIGIIYRYQEPLNRPDKSTNRELTCREFICRRVQFFHSRLVPCFVMIQEGLVCFLLIGCSVV